MNRNINLIPTEMAVPARAVKIAKLLTKISIIGASLLVIMIITIGSYFLYLSTKEKEVNKSVDNLKQKVIQLSQNEQKLILAKDRLSKIAIVQKTKTASSEVLRYQEFSEVISGLEGVQVTEASMNSKGTDVTVVIKDSSYLTSLLTHIPEMVNYKKIIISSLGFNKNSGFLANIILESE